MVNPPSLYSAFPWNSAARFFRAVFGVLVLLAAAGTASAQVFICHVKPDSTDALTSAGGAAPYEDGAMQPTLRVAIHTLRNDAGVGGCSGADVDSLWVRAMEDFSAVDVRHLG